MFILRNECDEATLYRAGIEVEKGWPCEGPLLRLAEDLGKRLLPAFDTPTGMPYGTVKALTSLL